MSSKELARYRVSGGALTGQLDGARPRGVARTTRTAALAHTGEAAPEAGAAYLRDDLGLRGQVRSSVLYLPYAR